MRRRCVVSIIGLGLLGAGLWLAPPARPDDTLLLGSPGISQYRPQGVVFSATPAWAKLTGTLTGSSNGKSGLASVWLKNTNASGATRYVITENSSGGVTGGWSVRFSSTGVLVCSGLNAANTSILDIRTTATLAAASAWSHVLCSWNLATGRGQVYVNDVADTAASPTLTNDTIVYNNTLSALGADQTGALPYASNVADLQVWFNVDVDISVAANRRALIDASKRAVAPGIAAAALSTPILAFYGTPANWQTNKGSGGGFTNQAGTVTAAADSPL